jgi:hypothetical protein
LANTYHRFKQFQRVTAYAPHSASGLAALQIDDYIHCL